MGGKGRGEKRGEGGREEKRGRKKGGKGRRKERERKKEEKEEGRGKEKGENLHFCFDPRISVTRQRKLMKGLQTKWVLIHCAMSVGAENWYRASLFDNVEHIKFSFCGWHSCCGYGSELDEITDPGPRSCPTDR